MISTTTAKMINTLPKPLTRFLSKEVVQTYMKKYARIHMTGQESLEVIKTPCIFVCNHLSNADGIVLSEALKKIDPTFVAGVKLSNNAVTNVGVNIVKTTNIDPSGVDKEGLKRIIKLVKQGESILIFPEGTRSRVGSLIEAKKGVLFISKMTGAPFVPIGLCGTEKLLPINKEGDMSSESFHHAEVTVNIGKQFELPAILEAQDKKEYDAECILYIMKRIAELLPEEYRGVYR